MTGILMWKQPLRRERSIQIRERSVLHVRFLCAEVARGVRTPETVLRRRLITAAKRLRKAGVTQVVLPADLTDSVFLEKCGLQPVSTRALRQFLAADWVRWSLAQRGLAGAGARVAVSADQLTGAVVRTVTELSLRHRYVLLEVPTGGEELCRRLRREYGVSVLLHPTEMQLEGADALALMDGTRDLRGPAVLPVYDEAVPLPPLSLPPALEEKLPQGVDRGQLLAVLREAGALRAGQLTVG